MVFNLQGSVARNMPKIYVPFETTSFQDDAICLSARQSKQWAIFH